MTASLPWCLSNHHYEAQPEFHNHRGINMHLKYPHFPVQVPASNLTPSHRFSDNNLVRAELLSPSAQVCDIKFVSSTL